MPTPERRPSWPTGLATALAFAILGLGADEPAAPEFAAPEGAGAALGRISEDSLRGHLSFLASDLLEGRDTPSRGLDLAAEYIAAQFRRAGLEAVGDDGYFQTAEWSLAEPNPEGLTLEIRSGPGTIRVGEPLVSLPSADPLDLTNVAITKVDARDAAALEALTPGQVEGRAILVEIPDLGRLDRSQRAEAIRVRRAFQGRMVALKAALVVAVDRGSRGEAGLGPGRLIDPETGRGRGAFARPGPPEIRVHAPAVVRLFDDLPAGPAEATLSLHLAAPLERPVKLRNVVGLLRGSDPELKETYVLVTAHYDHVGLGAPEGGDRIYNGANDDGSGTVSVIELASALATLQPRPRRSLVFMTFFGEEKGLLGSRYYARHPVFPIDRTVADVNLEQVGRTDSSEGPQLANASVTGIDFSDVGSILTAAGEKEGVRVYKHPQNSDAYFGASDNQALADLGVPAHTVCVAYAYPDYHGPLDHWQKVDFANMAKVDRMVGLGLLTIANDPRPPRWNEANPKAARYAEAWKARHEPRP